MSRKYKASSSGGFTLIEVLLIIAIIGLLFSVIMANLQDARHSSRDAAMKQQVRSSATLFEYQRNQSGGLYQNFQPPNIIGAVGNDGVAETCGDKTFIGEFSAKLQELCYGITREAEYTDPNVLIYTVIPSLQDGTRFSIMVQLNDGNWFCVGSNGGTYEGPFDINQRSCAGNP